MILYLKSIRGGPVKKKHPVIVYEAMALKWIKKKNVCRRHPPPIEDMFYQKDLTLQPSLTFLWQKCPRS